MDYTTVCRGYILNKQVVVTTVEHLQYDVAYAASKDDKEKLQMHKKLSSIRPVKRTAILQRDFVALYKGTKRYSESDHRFNRGDWKLFTHELCYGKLRYALALVREKTGDQLDRHKSGFLSSGVKLLRTKSTSKHNAAVDPLPLVKNSCPLPLVGEPAGGLEAMVLLFETRSHRRLWKDRLSVCIGIKPTDTALHNSTLFDGCISGDSGRTVECQWWEQNSNNDTRNGRLPPIVQRENDKRQRLETNRQRRFQQKLDDIVESSSEVSEIMMRDQRRRELRRITTTTAESATINMPLRRNNSAKVVISPRPQFQSVHGEIIETTDEDDHKTLVSSSDKSNSPDKSHPTRLKSMQEMVDQNDNIKAMIDTIYNGKLPDWHVLNGPVYNRPPEFDLPTPPG